MVRKACIKSGRRGDKSTGKPATSPKSVPKVLGGALWLRLLGWSVRPKQASWRDGADRMSEIIQGRITVGTAGGLRDIATLQRSGDSPGLFWLGGYRSE